MSDSKENTDELAGTEQPFVQHLMELRDRLLYGIAGLGLCMALLAFWPGPSGLIDMIAVPIRAHMPPEAKLIAVGVFSPFILYPEIRFGLRPSAQTPGAPDSSSGSAGWMPQTQSFKRPMTPVPFSS